jgi:hypothetical protein
VRELPPDLPVAAREPLQALLDEPPPGYEGLSAQLEEHQAWIVEACRGRPFEELERRTSLAAACAILLDESKAAAPEGARLARAVVALCLDRSLDLDVQLGAMGALCLDLGRPDIAPRAALRALAAPPLSPRRRWTIRVIAFVIGLAIAYALVHYGP